MGVYCFKCEKLFSTQGNFNRHRKEVHELKSAVIQYDMQVSMLKCLEGCGISYKFKQDLRDHLQIHHEIRQDVIEKSFSSFNEFEVWLKLEEQHCNVRYIQTKRKFRKCDEECKNETIYFDCSRSGKSRTIPETDRKRKSKCQGSSKLNHSCTSQIIVNISSESCQMKYFSTHYGHGEDLQHIRISKAGREMIASKLMIGVSQNHLIDSVRDHISSDLKRDDLMTIEDIKNIKNSYNIHMKDGYRHKNDRLSVHLRIQEWEQWDENPILFYKPQDVLEVKRNLYDFKKTDFCLIYMNSMQKQLLTKFGFNIICADSTHGLNQYDFELTTILIIDEFGQGFPCAFMFTNRKDTYVFEIFFTEIKKVVGEITAKVFMSDITGVFYNAWVKVMGIVEKQLYCAWHIDRAWQQNLKKIDDPDDRKWVYKTLKYLQTILMEDEFEQEFNKFLEILENKYKVFFEYMLTYYAPQKLKWAYCYRKKSGINTNMHIENMHKIIKHIYFEGKCVRRLDKSLNVLEKFVRDKTIDRIIKLTKGKHTEHSNAIYKRHRAAVTQTFDLTVLSEASYVLKNFTDEFSYSVVKVNSNICCALVCKLCNICVHSYECSCMDYSIKHTICKHIHYVCLKVPVDKIELNCESTDNSINTTEVDSLTSHLDQAKVKSANAETIIEQIVSTSYQVVQNVKSSAHSPEHLDQILQNLKSALLLSALTPELNVFCSKPVKVTPANKKIEKQSFFSTKKKLGKKHINKKPNNEEKSIIKQMLNESIFTTSNPENDHKYT